MGLFFVPDSIETLEFPFRQKLTEMASDDDASGMDNEFDEAIVQYACFNLWNDLQGRENKAAQAIENYREAIGRCKTQFLGDQRRDESFLGWSHEAIN